MVGSKNICCLAMPLSLASTGGGRLRGIIRVDKVRCTIQESTESGQPSVHGTHDFFFGLFNCSVLIGYDLPCAFFH